MTLFATKGIPYNLPKFFENSSLIERYFVKLQKLYMHDKIKIIGELMCSRIH